MPHCSLSSTSILQLWMMSSVMRDGLLIMCFTKVGLAFLDPLFHVINHEETSLISIFDSERGLYTFLSQMNSWGAVRMKWNIRAINDSALSSCWEAARESVAHVWQSSSLLNCCSSNCLKMELCSAANTGICSDIIPKDNKVNTFMQRSENCRLAFRQLQDCDQENKEAGQDVK